MSVWFNIINVKVNDLVKSRHSRENGNPENSNYSFFPNLYVRVSLKGACPEDFARLTGAKPEGFTLQIKALESLVRAGVDCFPAVMTDFSSQDRIVALRQQLTEIRPDFANFEEEELILYPFVVDHLQETGLK